MRQLNRMIATISLALIGTAGYAAQPQVTAQLITVVNEMNQPVPGATVMLGYQPGDPFPGNVFTTDAQGIANFPADWKAALPLTIQAEGYITSTIPLAQPGVQTLRLNHQEPQNDIEVKGTTTDYGRLVTDGKVDFGLVMPAVSRRQMLAFDVSSLISPQSDVIDILGHKTKIPSNLALPQQRETYIFPITLNKPDYRVYVRQPGAYRLGVTHGQFPLQRVVNEIRNGKSVLDVVNYFDFKEGSVRDLTIDHNLSGVDLAVNQTPFSSSFTVQAPTFDDSKNVLSMAMAPSGDDFVPTDVKRLTSGQSMTMKTSAGGQPMLLSLLMENQSNALDVFEKTLLEFFAPLTGILPPQQTVPTQNQDFSKLSFAFLPASGGVAPQFLPLINKPVLDGQVMKFQVPALINGVVPAAMYLTLSEIQTVGDGVKIERRTRLWEIWSKAWLDQIELPKLPVERKPDRTYRWDVIFLAHPAQFVNDPLPGDPVDLNTITHATRNSLDI